MEKRKHKIDVVAIILIVILIIVSYCYAQITFLGKDYINFCGYSIFQVITGSMSGTIEIDDIVILKLTKDVEVNDIITYKSGDDFVTHRVVEKDGNTIITKGDANNAEDSPITTDKVVGKVIFIISNVAIWIDVLKTPQVIIAIVITIIAICFVFHKKNN